MHVFRIRHAVALAALAAVSIPLALLDAGPAAAQGGGGGGGGKPVRTCSVTSSSIQAGVVAGQPVTVTVEDAGTVVLTRDAANDGLIVGTVTPNPGWTGSASTASGPQVIVDYQAGSGLSKQLEALQSAAYYGPDTLAMSVKTCTR